MSWNNTRYLAGLMEEHSPLTVPELAARAQLSEVTVRRHLASMLAAGAVRSLGGLPERFEWLPSSGELDPAAEAATIASWVDTITTGWDIDEPVPPTNRARARALRARMAATREPYTVAARRHDERQQVLRKACMSCLKGTHPACDGQGALQGPCSCQDDQHRILLAEPLTEAERARYRR
jgi:hypothetical protein